MGTRKASQHHGREAALVLARRSRRRLHGGDVGAVLAALAAAVALVQEGPEGVDAVLGRLRHRHALDELVRVGVLGVRGGVRPKFWGVQTHFKELSNRLLATVAEKPTVK